LPVRILEKSDKYKISQPVLVIICIGKPVSVIILRKFRLKKTKNPAFTELFADLNVVRDPGLSSNLSIASQEILSIE